MAEEPLVRALTSHVALRYIDDLPAAQRDSILRLAGNVDGARAAFQFGWIPFRGQVQILDAMRSCLTPEAWLASQRALMLGYLDKPVLRGLFDVAVRMLGLSVLTLAKWSPRGYDALFKHAGALRYEAAAAPNQATIVLEDFPLELFASHSFVEAMQASLEMIFVLAKAKGRVTVTAIDDRRGSARYSLRW